VTFLPQAWAMVWGVSSAPPAIGQTPMGVADSGKPSLAVGYVREAAHQRGNELERRPGFGFEFAKNWDQGCLFIGPVLS
jgi:hypothetical protein